MENRVDVALSKVRPYFYIAMAILGILIVTDFLFYFKRAVFVEQYLGVFITVFLMGVFISSPIKKGSSFTLFDILLAVLSIPAGLYLAFNYPAISLSMGSPDTLRIAMGALTILLILEALRRTMGIMLTSVVAFFIIFARFSEYMPGLLRGHQTTTERLINYIYIDPSSMLWMISFGATVGVAFIFFGQLMIYFGGGQAFVDMAMVIVGRLTGGSAKVAVISSSLVGTITGAPMSNVLLTGSFTIPMMKKSGYQPRMAAAIEAVASSGGQLMPPIMGIAAFIIADTVGVPYATVALAALLPAILYYFCIFMQVDLEARKENMAKVDPATIPSLKQALTKGWFIFPPIIILLGFMFWVKYPPALSAIYAGFLSLPFLYAVKENRTGFFRKFVEAMKESGELMINIAVVMSAAGLVIGAINASGLAFNLSLALVHLAEGNVVLLLIAAAAASLVLGMGMPSVAAYALVAILVAPALTRFGILPIAAHLFVFYFSVISNITPPVAVSCFAAAPLAGANPTQTGFTAARLGIASYIVPFLFVFSPALLLQGSAAEIASTFFFAAVGVFVVSVALTGYFAKVIQWPQRVALLIASALILVPAAGFILHVVGTAAAAILLFHNRQTSTPEAQTVIN